MKPRYIPPQGVDLRSKDLKFLSCPPVSGLETKGENLFLSVKDIRTPTEGKLSVYESRSLSPSRSKRAIELRNPSPGLAGEGLS